MQIIAIDTKSPYYLWAPSVLTGTDLNPERNILLEITGGRIASKKNVAADQLPDAVINHPNCCCLPEETTLLPALTDAHVHLALDGEENNLPKVDCSDRPVPVSRLEENGRAYLTAGVGYVRDGGDCLEINLECKNGLNGKRFVGPQVIATGSALRREDTYGSFLGRGYSSPQEIPAIVRRLWSAGVDQIKVIVSGVVSFSDYGRVGGPLLLPEEIAAIVHYAHQYNLRVMAHASSAIAVDLAARAGVDSIEHGYFIHSENLKLMADKGIAWVPTIIPVAAQVRNPTFKQRTIQEIEVITRIYEEQIEKLEQAYKLGVPLGLGTDAGAAGVRHGSSLIDEILLYAESPLSNRAVLKAATSVNAGITGLENAAGSIVIGRRANLIVVRGNPLEDLSCLKEVTTHFIAG